MNALTEDGALLASTEGKSSFKIPRPKRPASNTAVATLNVQERDVDSGTPKTNISSDEPPDNLSVMLSKSSEECTPRKPIFYRPWDDGGQSLLDHVTALIEQRLRKKSCSRAVPIRPRPHPQKSLKYFEESSLVSNSVPPIQTTKDRPRSPSSSMIVRPSYAGQTASIQPSQEVNGSKDFSPRYCPPWPPLYVPPFSVHPFSTTAAMCDSHVGIGFVQSHHKMYGSWISSNLNSNVSPQSSPTVLSQGYGMRSMDVVSFPFHGVEFVNNGHGFKNPCVPRSEIAKTASKKQSPRRKCVETIAVGKRFLCSICGKGFNDTFDLKRHTRTHTGVRPYKCDHCAKSFTQRCSLETHSRKLHGVTFSFGYKERRDKLYVCEDCGDATSNIEAHYVHLQCFHALVMNPS